MRRRLFVGTPTAPPCVRCGTVMERYAEGATASVVETLDNGAMARRLTRPADAERLHRERVAAADPLAGGAIRVDKARG